MAFTPETVFSNPRTLSSAFIREIRGSKAFRHACRASARNHLFRLAPSSYGPAIMPKVFEKDGFRFFFYSNEHGPIHVHARYGDGEAVFDVEPVVELRESYGLRVAELSKAQKLAEEHRELIIEKWHEHLG